MPFVADQEEVSRPPVAGRRALRLDMALPSSGARSTPGNDEMTKRKLAYIWSLRNAAADKAGQYDAVQGRTAVHEVGTGVLGGGAEPDCAGRCLRARGRDLRRRRGAASRPGKNQGLRFRLSSRAAMVLSGRPAGARQDPERPLAQRAVHLPSVPAGTPEHVAGKSDFERRLHDTLVELGADVVVLDGLLVILDELVRPGARSHGGS